MAKKPRAKKPHAKKSKKQEYISEEVFQGLDEGAKKSEQFIEKNAKYLAIAFGALLLVAIGYFVYLKTISDPNNNQALNKLVKAQELFQKDSLDSALGGTTNMGSDGFADIYESYGRTGAGKLSGFYAGIIEYKKGNYQKALDYFNGFNSDDDIANALKYGAIADIYVQLKKNSEALSNYDKAIAAADNTGVKVYFMKKAGVLAIVMKRNKEALGYFQTISDKYSDVDTSGEVEAYLEKLSYINGNS